MHRVRVTDEQNKVGESEELSFFFTNISDETLYLPSLSLSLSLSLSATAKWGGKEVTRVLLEAGALVAQATTLGVQPLHMAAQEGQVRLAALPHMLASHIYGIFSKTKKNKKKK